MYKNLTLKAHHVCTIKKYLRLNADKRHDYFKYGSSVENFVIQNYYGEATTDDSQLDNDEFLLLLKYTWKKVVLLRNALDICLIPNRLKF